MRRLAGIARYMLWTGVFCGTLAPVTAQEPPPKSADIEFFETVSVPYSPRIATAATGPKSSSTRCALTLGKL